MPKIETFKCAYNEVCQLLTVVDISGFEVCDSRVESFLGPSPRNFCMPQEGKVVFWLNRANCYKTKVKVSRTAYIIVNSY